MSLFGNTINLPFTPSDAILAQYNAVGILSPFPWKTGGHEREFKYLRTDLALGLSVNTFMQRPI